MAESTLALRLNLTIDDEYEVDADLLRSAAAAVVYQEGLRGRVRVDVLITDDDHIQALNREYRGVDQPTDVLSFPLQDLSPETEQGEGRRFVLPPRATRNLGDVVISFPTAQRQAAEFGHTLRRELAYLCVHGLLHLLGYDHENEEQRRAMREREERALAAVGALRSE